MVHIIGIDDHKGKIPNDHLKKSDGVTFEKWFKLITDYNPRTKENEKEYRELFEEDETVFDALICMY